MTPSANFVIAVSMVILLIVFAPALFDLLRRGNKDDPMRREMEGDAEEKKRVDKKDEAA